MTETTLQPTQNPVAPDLRALLVAIGLETKKQINCARIGSLISFNSENATATVQIAQQTITGVSPEGIKTSTQFSPLVSVPVFILGGGGISATFPFGEGDECLVIFNDREIDNWLISGGINSVPTTQRVHDLSDGMCFIGFRSFPRSLNGYSTNSAQLRTDNGETYVEVTQAGVVNAVSPTSINLTAPEVNINASTSVTIDTPVETITGTLNVENTGSETEPFTVNGNMEVTGDVVASGVSLVNHVHSGVQSGGSDTGPPV